MTYFNNYWEISEDEFDVLMLKDARYFTYVDSEYIQKKHVDMYIKSGYFKLRVIPREFMNEKIVINYMKNNKWTIKDLPREYITKEMIDSLDMENINDYYNYIPDHLKTPEITSMFIQQTDDIELYDLDIITQEAVDKYVNSGNFFLGEIPDEFITDEIVEKYINLPRWSISQIKNITQSIVDRYMSLPYWYLSEIPYEFKTDEIVFSYIKQFKTLLDVPRKYMTPEFIKEYILDGGNIKNIPALDITQDILKLYIDMHPNEEIGFESSNINSSFILEHIKNVNFVLHKIPKKCIDRNVIIALMEKKDYRNIFPYIQQYNICDVKTLVHEYITFADWDIMNIPREFINEEIVNEYIKKPNWKLKKIPPTLITQEIVDKYLPRAKNIFVIPYQFRKSSIRFNIEINYDCCICKNNYDSINTVYFPCNHSYCVYCHEYYKNMEFIKCPLCRYFVIN